MKRSLLLVVTLLAVASLMAAMAYTYATVENNANVKIVNTDDALLALIPGSDADATDGSDLGNKDKTAFIGADGAMYFNFNKGLGGTNFGLQNGATYKWQDIFWVKNNSEDKIEFTVNASKLGTADVGKNWLDIGIHKNGYNQEELFVADGVNTGTKVVLNPGEMLPIAIRIQLSYSTHAKAVTGDEFANGMIKVVANPVK